MFILHVDQPEYKVVGDDVEKEHHEYLHVRYLKQKIAGASNTLTKVRSIEVNDYNHSLLEVLVHAMRILTL